jgi:HK97 family phage prohead protease
MPMDIEHKAFGASISAQPEGVIEAIVSVFSNTDLANEKVMPGAFAKSISTKLPKVVWQHDWRSPIGKTLEVRELQAGDPRLPANLSDFGGLYVKGQLNLKTQRGKEAYEDLAFGAIDEFSIGYQVIKDNVEEKSGTRELHEILLREWSPVLVGCNDSTALLSVKEIDTANEPATLANQVESMLACGVQLANRFKSLHELRTKEGRVFSATNRQRIGAVRDSMRSVADELHTLLEMSEPQPKAADDLEVRRVYAEFLKTMTPT